MIKFILLIFLFLVQNSAFSAYFPERDNKGRVIQRTAGLRVDQNSRVRFIGTHDFQPTVNQTTSGDWVIPQLQYGGVNKTSSMSGVNFHVDGGCLGDYVDFQVVHPQAGVIDEFAKNFYIFPGESFQIKEHRAELPAGLTIRVVYTSTCATQARFMMNLLRYVETD